MPRAKKDVNESPKLSKSKATTVEKSAKTKKTNITTKKETTKTKTKTKSTKSVVTKKRKKLNKVPSLATKRRSTKKAIPTIKEDTNEKYINVLEYYDLPYHYNETVVKILAQTPKILYVYWDISDSDREKYKEKYGEKFFNDTYPVLVVHNKSLNYHQEIEINDFANSWYLSIPDSRSEYSVSLGRRYKQSNNYSNNSIDNSLIEFTCSNDLIMPNDHVLLDEIKPMVKFKNVKTNQEYYKNTHHILVSNKLIDFYNLYKELYQVEDLSHIFNLNNPSSGNPTSTFK